MGKIKEKLNNAKEYVKENWKPILKKAAIGAGFVIATGIGAVVGFKAGQSTGEDDTENFIPELTDGSEPEEETPFEEEVEEEEESDEENEEADAE